MKEYKCFEIGIEGIYTQRMLNEFAEEGWRLICSYSKNGYWLIMERNKKICKGYGK